MQSASGRDQQFGKFNCYINEIIKNVRRMSRALRPSILEDLGLVSALRYLFAEFSKFQKIRIASDMEDIDGLLSPEAQITIRKLGLAAMDERVRWLGGELDVAGNPETGTRISFMVRANA